MDVAQLAGQYHVDDESGCWLWQGSLNPDGYGVLYLGSRTTKDLRKCRAHRVVYELYRGPIPDGLVLDHLCLIRRCVNPDHLEAVTQRENLLRSKNTLAHKNAMAELCKHGHEFTPANTLIEMSRGRPSRRCRICRHNNGAAAAA